MKVTNLIAQFVKIVTKTFQNHIPNVMRQFVDNIGVKSPKKTAITRKLLLRFGAILLNIFNFLTRFLLILRKLTQLLPVQNRNFVYLS